MDPIPPDQTVACPRCGYELRGVVVTWTDSCPLDGTCSECGLAFEWGELLSPSRSIPPWCVEARPPRFVTPRQALATLGRTLWPWSLWRRVRMSHPCRWGRIVGYLLLLVVGNYMLFAAATGIMAAREFGWASQLPGVTLNTDPWRVGLHAAAFPFSSRGFGTYSGGRGRVFPASAPRYFSLHVRSGWMGMGVFLSVALTASGLAFAVLPISRRRAKVRWAHIVRVTTYALAIPLVVLCVESLVVMLPDSGGPLTDALGPLVLVIYGAVVLWALAWWHAAARCYLRMEHAAAVSGAVVVLGFLGTLSGWGVWYLTFG